MIDTVALSLFVHRLWLAVVTWAQWAAVEFVITWLESIELRIACFILLLQCSTFLYVWIIVRNTQRPLQCVFYEAHERGNKDS